MWDRFTRGTLAVCAACALLLAACGSDSTGVGPGVTTTDTDGSGGGADAGDGGTDAGADTDEDDGSPDTDTGGGGCAVSADCAGGELCVDGVCRRACIDDGDCDTDEVCDESLCVPSLACSGNADCAGGELCRDGMCVPVGGPACTNGDSECIDAGSGRICDGGSWMPFVCADSVCENGECVPGTDLNACGGEDPLDGAPGDACGDCGFLVCDGANALSCDEGGNACGGCDALDGEPGTACATDAGDGIWACDGEEAVICEVVTPGGCTSDEECQAEAADLGADNADAAVCDPDVGCVIPGVCNPPDGGGNDPFDAECLPDSMCRTSPIPLQPARCTCAGMDAPCRAGEVCEQDFTLGAGVFVCNADGGFFP